MYEDAEVWLDHFAASLECWYADIGAADSLELLNNNYRTGHGNPNEAPNDIRKPLFGN